MNYNLPPQIGSELQSNFLSGVKSTWSTYFPGATFGIIVLQFIIFGFLIGLSYRLLTPKNSSNPPKYH